MKIVISVPFVLLVLLCLQLQAQHISDASQATLDQVEQFQLQNKPKEALNALSEAIGNTKSVDDLAYLYAFQSGLYSTMDSLLIRNETLELRLENAQKSKKNTSKAVAYRAKAFLNNTLNLPDSVVKDAL